MYTPHPAEESPQTTNSQYIVFPRNPLRQLIEVLSGIACLAAAAFLMFGLVSLPPNSFKVGLFFFALALIATGLTFFNVAYARSCGPITWTTLWTMKGMPFLLLGVGVQFVWRIIFRRIS
jgi:hypothetical protein